MLSSRDKLLLVDCNALLHRAWHAIRTPMSGETSKQGNIPTHGLYGFMNMLLAAIERETPDYVIVVHEKGKTWRDAEYPEYKATRKAKRAATDTVGSGMYGFDQQYPLLEEILQTLGIPMLSAPGYEADDLIATLTSFALQAGINQVRIVTGDKDLLQVLAMSEPHPYINRVVVLMPNGKVTNQTDHPEYYYGYTRARFVEHYGFEPALFPDYKALIGDKSDNLIGVNGIGEVTAKKLVSQFGGLESILAAVVNNTAALSPSIRAKIEAGLNDLDNQQAYQMRKLATLTADIKGLAGDYWYKNQWEKCRFSSRDVNKQHLELLFSMNCGFPNYRRILDRLERAWVSTYRETPLAVAAAPAPAPAPAASFPVRENGQISMW